jgi:hypothetical protein
MAVGARLPAGKIAGTKDVALNAGKRRLELWRRAGDAAELLVASNGRNGQKAGE